MGAGGSSTSRKREAAIAALLSNTTIAEASATAGVPESTLYRWLQDPSFQHDFRKARRALIDLTVSHLAKTGIAAMTCMVEIMQDPAVHAQWRVHAAKVVMDSILRTVELDVASQMATIDERLRLLEGAADAEPA